MVDALALGASGVTHGGSSPLLGTKNITQKGYFFCRERANCFARARGLEEVECVIVRLASRNET